VNTRIVARRALIIDPSQGVYGILPLCGVGATQNEKDFRTINIQWIGQWGLFGRCGTSQKGEEVRELLRDGCPVACLGDARPSATLMYSLHT
jgi:hypothetical protein